MKYDWCNTGPRNVEGSTDEGWDENPGALIFIAHATDVRFEGNRVEDLGKFNRTLVQATPGADIEGAKTGVVLTK